MTQIRSSGRWISMVIAVLILLTASHLLNAQSDDKKENVNYKWTFAAKVGQGDSRKLVTVSRDTILRSGDQIKLFVNLQRKSYVYVIHRSPSNELTLLFPYSLESQSEMEKNYYIPKGRDWFTLDKNAGEETYYILAASERLTELEDVLRSYTVAQPEKKKDLAVNVVNSVKEIKKRFRTFATLAERPISIAGNVRGTKTGSIDIDRVDIATLATEISANNFYSKTITVDHK
jgi:hypothetical protein